MMQVQRPAGTDAVQPNGSPRFAVEDWNGQQVAVRRAFSGLDLALLQNEAQALLRLEGVAAPELISLTDEDGSLTLRRTFLPGCPLSDLSRDRWPGLLMQLRRQLDQVHAQGIIHGDLKPENLIVNDGGLTPVDWEHALPLGADLAGLPFRGASPGTADPRLIWGRGTVDCSLDFYSIDRMLGRSLPP